jgi:sugar phosphate isomerase/epimerase
VPHQYSLAYLTVFGLAPPDMVLTAARAGYDFVSLRMNPVTTQEPVHPLAQDRGLRRRTLERLSQTGVRVLDVELFRLTRDFDVSACEALLDASQELGARCLIAQAADDDLGRATDRFASLCDAAQSRNLTVDLEFVTWTETPDLERAAQIVRGADRGNGGLLVDTLHFSRSGCSIADLAALPRSWFHFAQLCDAPAAAPDSVEGLIHAARNERLFLGDGDLDLRGILCSLPAGIPFSLEIPRASLAQRVGLDEVAQQALVSARRYIEAFESMAGKPAPARSPASKAAGG